MVLCMDNVGQTLVSYLQQSRRILVTPKMDFGSAEIHLIGVNALEQKTSVGIVALAGTLLKSKSLDNSADSFKQSNREWKKSGIY